MAHNRRHTGLACPETAGLIRPGREGRPQGAPPVNIWSVVPHRGVLLASDRDHGLYVLDPDAG